MKKILTVATILILGMILFSCVGNETEPITELYFDTLLDLDNFLRSDHVKIYDPELTENQVIEKYDINLGNLGGDMKYSRNYVFSDITQLNSHITDSCFKMELDRNDVPEDDIQGLPNLVFFYEVSNIEGLKGIFLSTSPNFQENLPTDLNQELVLIFDNISHGRLDWGKSITGYEPKPFVLSIDMRDTVENKELVSHAYNVVYTNGLYDVYYIYEKEHQRTQDNTDFELLINGLFIVNNYLVTITS